MKRVVLMFTLILAVMAVRCQQNDHVKQDSSSISLIEVESLQQLIDDKVDFQLIDVRTPKEFQGGTINDAINIDFRNPEFKNQFTKQVDPEKPVYLFCRSGRRSAAAANVLQELGYKKIYDLKGGYLAWPKE